MTKPSLPELLHAAVTAVGGTERPGQVDHGRSRRRGDRRQLPPAGPGRHRHRKVARLPGARAGARRAGRRGDGHPGPAAPARGAGPAAHGRRAAPAAAPPPASSPCSRAGRTTCACTACTRACRRTRRRASSTSSRRPRPPASSARICCGCATGRTRPRPATGTTSRPGVSDRAWAQVSVSSRECLGATKCAYGAECFAEAARERAKLAEVVVTNHALLAIDAIEGAPVLPQHEVLIVDEAHELVSRVTGVATGELTPGQVNRAVRRAAKLVNEKAADALQTAAEGFERLMELALPGPPGGDPRGPRLRPDGAARRRAHGHLGARRHPRQVRPGRGRRPQAGAGLRGDRARRGGADHATAPSTTSSGTSGTTASAPPCGSPRCPCPAAAGEALRGPLRGPDLGDPQARRRLQRRRAPRWASPPRARRGRGRARSGRASTSARPSTTRKQGILYVARHLAPPGRDGDRGDMLDELAELMEAAGGRTLGLFSSMRAAQAAAEELRGRLDESRSCCRARRRSAS